METKEAIDKLKSDLAGIKAQGQETIPIEGLENYLSALEKDASASLESRKLEFQGMLADHDARVKFDIEIFKTANEAGREALKAALIINGGAVIAFLGFLGSMLSKGGAEALGLKLTIPLCSFGFGVLFAALGFGVRYLTQFCYAKRGKKAWINAGHFSNFVTILLATAALTVFGFGVYRAYAAFVSHFTIR